MSTRTIDELLDISSKAWKPEEDSPASISGELIERKVMPGEKYGPYPFLSVLPAGASEAWAVHVFGTVLKNEVEAQDPQVGDQVGIKYLGTPAGKEYKLYKLVVIPGDGVPRAAAAAPVGLPTTAPVTDVPDPFGNEPF